MALFVQLDANWPDNEKIMAVGPTGAGAHAIAMCLAKRLETDGVVPRAQLIRHDITHETIDLLVAEQLFDVVDDRRIRIHDWLDRNPSTAVLRAASRKGNHKRHGHAGDVQDCPICSPSPQGREGTSEGTQPDLSTEDAPKTPNLVDNSTGSRLPRSLPESPHPTNRDLPPDPPGDDQGLLESYSYTESDTDLEETTVPRADSPPEARIIAEQAFALMADEQITQRPPHGDPAKYRRSAIAGIHREHHQQAYRYLHLNPALTPPALMDLLRTPPPGSPRSHPDPGRRYDIETEADTQARIAEMRAFTPPDPNTVRAAADPARHAIAHPTAPVEPETT